jgi:hypothetical protein
MESRASSKAGSLQVEKAMSTLVTRESVELWGGPLDGFKEVVTTATTTLSKPESVTKEGLVIVGCYERMEMRPDRFTWKGWRDKT